MNTDTQPEPTIELALETTEPFDPRDAKLEQLNEALAEILGELETSALRDAA